MNEDTFAGWVASMAERRKEEDRDWKQAEQIAIVTGEQTFEVLRRMRRERGDSDW